MPLCQGFSTVGRRKRMAQETLRMQGEENISKYTAHLLSRHHYLKREKWEKLLAECSGYVSGMETKEWETLPQTKRQIHENTQLATSRAKPLQSCQAPLSMGFCRQECWSGWPCPPPGDLPDPGIDPTSLMPPALARGLFTTSVTGEAQVHHSYY